MENFLRSVSSVLIIFLLTALGYICAAKGWLVTSAKRFINRFLITMAIPAMCVYELSENLSREAVIESLPILLVCAVSLLVTLGMSFLVGKYLLRLERTRFGVFLLMCCTTNAIFVGLPMCTELFGSDCTPYVMMFYLVNTVMIQAVSQTAVRSMGTVQGGKSSACSTYSARPTRWACCRAVQWCSGTSVCPTCSPVLQGASAVW